MKIRLEWINIYFDMRRDSFVTISMNNVNYIEIASCSLHRFSFTGSGQNITGRVFQLIASFELFLEKKKYIITSFPLVNFILSIFSFEKKQIY